MIVVTEAISETLLSVKISCPLCDYSEIQTIEGTPSTLEDGRVLVTPVDSKISINFKAHIKCVLEKLIKGK